MVTAIKQIYTRAELVDQDCDDRGQVFQVCNLCGGMSWEDEDVIDHENDCPLNDPNVLAIQAVTMTIPREDICGLDTCPKACCCFSDGWRGHTHEDLLLTCTRYACADAKNERK